ncbi:MAG: PEP-CTERM sorting domain-containing protein [Pirellulales bacterium]|nr:PEP-CTERM sorting domain-containing protein [Pirellulales bacterium]
MYKFGLSILLILGLAVTASAITVDGVLSSGEWDGYVATDPDDSTTEHVEMISWGAKVESGYLYWYCELGGGDGVDEWEDYIGSTGGTWKIFPGLWIDVDADEGGQPGDTGTWLTDGGTVNCADDGKLEWSSNHRGIDINLELGLIGSWTNGQNITGDGEGPGGSAYNYWGLGDDVGDVVDAVSNGSWYEVGSVMEGRVLLSELATKVSNLPDGATVGDYMKLAIGVQGTQRGNPINYGYDVGTPTCIASDSSSKALLAGDFNLDGDVDVEDLGILAGNYGTTAAMAWTMGDATRDGAVDVSDLGVLAGNYGSTVNAAAVPEPATICLLGLGSLTLLLWRRR